MAPLQVTVNQKEGLRFDSIPSFSAFPAVVVPSSIKVIPEWERAVVPGIARSRQAAG